MRSVQAAKSTDQGGFLSMEEKGKLTEKGVGGLKRSHTQTANHTLTPAPVSSVTESSSASSSKQPRIQDNDTMRINERERTTSVAEIRTSRTRRRRMLRSWTFSRWKDTCVKTSVGGHFLRGRCRGGHTIGDGNQALGRRAWDGTTSHIGGPTWRKGASSNQPYGRVQLRQSRGSRSGPRMDLLEDMVGLD